VADPVFVVSSDEWFRTELAHAAADLIPGGAALGGIYTPLPARLSSAFVVACDMPFLSVPLFERMSASVMRIS
jgi:molybdopterin-guanine dinucleotide biosynthesis protein A